LNLQLSELEDRIKNRNDLPEAKAFSYVVKSVNVKWNQDDHFFEQHGSAPNYQGDILTICTCKFQMRSRLSVEEWVDNVWTAGFTSRTILEDKHWLFFLSKVKTAHESHSDLWHFLDTETREKKAAHKHYLGDIFKPLAPRPLNNDRFHTRRYVKPKDHVHRRPGDNGWKKDISYLHAITGKRAPLLVANPNLTFIWEKPMIFLKKKHCRDYSNGFSFQELMDRLQQDS
jgi:hypothetical protein